MKVLMLAPLPPPSGGIASWTLGFKEYCENNDISLRIVNIAMQGNRATSEIMKRSLMVELKRTINIVSQLKRELKNERPDVIHFNTSCSPFGILKDALCVLLIHKKVPIVLHCHCNIKDQLGNNKLSIRVFKYLVSNSGAIIVLNKFSRQYVDEIESGKAVFVPNFASERILSENHVIRETIKKALFIGHIERDKGIVQIAEVARQLPNIDFSAVGAIREDISYIKIPSNLHIIGRVPVDEVQNYLGEADVFVFPSMTEGFSNALLEAMAAGLPVIASDVGANSEMIEGCGGVILKENTVEELLRAILSVSDPLIRKSMSEWNIKKVKTTYMIEDVMSEYFNIYEIVKRGS